MIKRTLYFGNPAYLKTKDEQLLVSFPSEEKPNAKVAIEDIGVIILDHWQITISQATISKLLANNAAVITCDARHMPHGLLLNLDGSHVQQEHFRVQVNASAPLKKQLWQQTVKAKIGNQARLLEMQGLPADNMYYWQRKTASGDPENMEGRAAGYYWKYVFSHYMGVFKRGRYEAEPNNLLNYGYAILRAIVARSLVSSGLLPTLGIYHRNKYNAYCLADDIMEPYRPFVDQLVLQILKEAEEDIYELTPNIKKALLQLPTVDVKMEKKRSPLMVAMQQTTASLYNCLEGSSRKIKYPSLEQ